MHSLEISEPWWHLIAASVGTTPMLNPLLRLQLATVRTTAHFGRLKACATSRMYHRHCEVGSEIAEIDDIKRTSSETAKLRRSSCRCQSSRYLQQNYRHCNQLHKAYCNASHNRLAGGSLRKGKQVVLQARVDGGASNRCV